MKRYLLTAAVCAVATLGFSISSATYYGKISLPASYNGSFPVTIDFYQADQSLILGLFNQKKVLKITNYLDLNTSATVTELADFSADYAWGSGRGISGLNVDQATGNIYVGGDTGSVPSCASILDSSGTKLLLGYCSERTGSFAKFNSAGTVGLVSPLLGSRLKTIDLTTITLPVLTQTDVFAAPYNAYLRDVAVKSDFSKIYYSRNGTTKDGYAVVNVPAPPDLTNLSSTGIIQGSGINLVAGLNLGLWETATKDYLLVPDVTAKTIRIIDLSTNVEVLSAGNSTILGTVRDACVGVIGGTAYLFATDVGAGDSAEIEVWKLEESTAASDWSLYY